MIYLCWGGLTSTYPGNGEEKYNFGTDTGCEDTALSGRGRRGGSAADNYVPLDLVHALNDDHERRVPEIPLDVDFG